MNVHLTRCKAEIILKTWAIFTDTCFFLSFLSKLPTPDFSQKVFFVSHFLFFLKRSFFLLLLTVCTGGSCLLLLSDECIQSLHAKFNIQGPEHYDDSKQGSYTELLLMSLLLMVSYQLISASAVLQMPFFPSTDFSLELQETDSSAKVCSFLQTCVITTG